MKIALGKAPKHLSGARCPCAAGAGIQVSYLKKSGSFLSFLAVSRHC
jgi:hypothetical protein